MYSFRKQVLSLALVFHLMHGTSFHVIEDYFGIYSIPLVLILLDGILKIRYKALFPGLWENLKLRGLHVNVLNPDSKP